MDPTERPTDEQGTRLRKLASVSHLNFLLGAGASREYLPILRDIEQEMDQAGQDSSALYIVRKRYFLEVMYPCLDLLRKPADFSNSLVATFTSYQDFFRAVTQYLLNRRSTLLDKQVNIFTTNIDIFIEKALEEMSINFNDGFFGRMEPKFSAGNFLTVYKKKSEHTNRQSEIPTFNVYKLHGSLSWGGTDEEDIRLSDLSLLKKLKANVRNEADFNRLYEELRIVNPTQGKYGKTQIDFTYYEMLRLYSTALENEQSLLFVMGFSFADKHILKMTKRALNSNPTLSICIFSHKAEGMEGFKQLFSDTRYSNNLYVVGPDGSEGQYDLKTIASSGLKEIFGGSELSE